DADRRRIIGEADAINQQRNTASKEIGALMQSGKKDEAEATKAEVAGLKDKQSALEKQRDESEAAMQELLATLPNIPAPDVPVGPDESANVEIRRWGQKPKFEFRPREHFDLGEGLGQMDFEAAARMSGARFVVLKGALARMERAIAQFM